MIKCVCYFNSRLQKKGIAFSVKFYDLIGKFFLTLPYKDENFYNFYLSGCVQALAITRELLRN